MGLLDKYKDDFIFLCESGFIAVNQMDEDAAKKLFKASMLLDPDNTLPFIGMGYLHLCKFELNDAAKFFEEVLKKEPTNEMAKAFLGMASSFTPDKGKKGEKILEEMATQGSDADAKKLATDALEFVDKFIKKTPGPAQVQKPK